jgi:hypothetical protein
MICAVERRGEIPSIKEYWIGSEEGNKRKER